MAHLGHIWGCGGDALDVSLVENLAAISKLTGTHSNVWERRLVAWPARVGRLSPKFALGSDAANSQTFRNTANQPDLAKHCKVERSVWIPGGAQQGSLLGLQEPGSGGRMAHLGHIWGSTGEARDVPLVENLAASRKVTGTHSYVWRSF